MTQETSVFKKKELPYGWKWSTIEQECEVNPRRPKDLKANDNQETSFVPMEAVDGDKGLIDDISVVPFSKVRKGYTYFEENDVLFAKITPCMQNKKSAIAKNLVNNYGFGTTEFHVIRCKESVIPEWIYYFIRHQKFIDEAERNFTGAVGQQRVPKTFLEDYPIIVPPIPEQQKIVDTLDKQMAQIEMMKKEAEEQKKFIKILFHSHLKNIFDIKENSNDWKLLKLGDDKISEIMMGQSPPSSSYNTVKKGLPFYQGKKDFGLIHPSPTVWCSEPKRVAKKGDILISIRAPVGPTNIADTDCCIGRGLASVRPKINRDFILFQLKTNVQKLQDKSNGSTFDAINKNELFDFEIMLPINQKQEKIVKYLKEKEIIIKKITNSLDIQLNAINQLPNSILNEVFRQYQLADET